VNEEAIWQAKLAARIHDPVEKAIVLLCDPAGHEGGTVRVLREKIFPNGTWKRWENIVKQADQWAAAADRPQFPQEEGKRFASWTQVRFTEKPELKHPLTGKSFDLRSLRQIDCEKVKERSTAHFSALIQYEDKDKGIVDWKRTVLAFWRFGPELKEERDDERLGPLWQLLPADTRVPDHTIWSHLDLASALAGAMAGDAKGMPALLTVSFGPVQSFIAQARSTSDLWAGSHLLSRITWEGLKVVCERLGPDAVLFPQLFGVPLVDAWIEEKLGGWLEGFDEPEWKRQGTDANPLYAAALPNRFVAIVPASQAARIAKEVERAARDWVMAQGKKALQKLRERSGVPGPDYADEQVARQLADFPECYWNVVPWSLVEIDGGNMKVDRLRTALEGFYPKKRNERDGFFFDSSAWKLLSKEIVVDGQRFYDPNGGVLYPAFYDLLERVNTSVKSLRPFAQQREEGYRCALCGEREWLHVERGDPEAPTGLFAPPGQRKALLWQGLPPSWTRKENEQLCALCTLKRLWPTLFADEVKQLTGKEQVRRFVISTHTMALVGDLVRKADEGVPESLKEIAEEKEAERVALPARLARKLGEKTRDFALVPGLLDAVREDEDERRKVEAELKEWLGHKPEAYYGLILFDGDSMGAWLRANEAFAQIKFEDCWHTQIRNTVREKANQHPELQAYLNENRPVSPARHAAISLALNSFALHLARFAVEEAHHGKLLYAGGDDVLAMVPVRDLLPCMRLLRLLYAGHVPEGIELPEDVRDVAHGFVRYRKRLMRVMCERATASAGAVVAHHMAPLGQVLKALRRAESRAKKQGDRDAFSICVLKRSGGAVETTARWFQQSPRDESRPDRKPLPEHPSVALEELARVLGGTRLSRRAAYHVQSQLRALPTREQLPDGFDAMLEATLVRQFKQQGGSEAEQELARRLARLACAVARNLPPENEEQKRKRQVSREAEWLMGFFAVAEFLGREGRMEDAA